MPSSWRLAWPLVPIDKPARRQLLRWTAGSLGLLAAAICLFNFNPAGHRFYPPCPFHWLTHLYCPGCGSLRALHHLLHGRWMAGLAQNPLMVIALPFLAALLVRPALGRRAWVCWTAFGVLCVYWILRNLPGWPFSLLAPG